MKRSNFGVRIGHGITVFLLVFIVSFTPITTHASTGFFTSLWCNVTELFGFPCAVPKVIVETNNTVTDITPQPEMLPTYPEPEPYAIANYADETPVVSNTIVKEYNTYVTNPTTVIYDNDNVQEKGNLVYDNQILDFFNKLLRNSPLFDKQVDKIYEKSNDNTDNVQENLDTIQTDNAAAFSTDLLTVTGNTSIDGDTTVGGDATIDGNTIVGGDLNVIGTITAGILNVAALSSGGALVAPYFTATSTTATSSFMGAVGIGTLTPSEKLTVVGNTYLNGNLTLAGIFKDSVDSAGSNGMILKTTGTSTQWVATSTLNIAISDTSGTLSAPRGGTGLSSITQNQLLIGGPGNTWTQIATSSLGFSSGSTFLGLTDTPSSFIANRLIFTNSGATALTDSANLVFDGTNFGIGSTTPSSKLTVAGSVDITNTATGSPAITLRDTVGGIALELRAGTSTLLNTFIGVDAGKTLTTGSQNSAYGYKALFSNTTGSDNSVNGYRALYNNTTGSNNIAIGSSAGRYLANGSSGNNTPNNSLYLGADTKASASNGANEIVIGYSAIGAGSNTVTLGSTTITTTVLQGNVGIGTTTPSNKLTIVGNTYLNGGLTLTGALKDSTSATGTLGMIMQTTGTSTQWVATSTLGLGNGTFLGLTDTPSSFTANRLMFTNSGGTALTDSANLVFDGTDLGLTGTTGLLLGGDTKLYRGFADALYLDSGDSLNIVSGSIQIASTTVISGTREVRAGNGTANSPSFTFSSDTNTGLFRQAADVIGFTTGGTERLRLTTSDLDFQSGGIAFGGTRYLYASSTNDSIVFGNNAGANFNSGTTFNTAIGFEAGRYASTSASDYNNFIGHQAGYGNTGERNNIIGITSGLNNTGSQNNLFGTAAGYNNTGSYNNIIGYWSGLNSTGSYNNFIGYQTSYKNVGNYNEIMGYQAGYNLQSTSSVIFGTEAYRGGSGVLAFQAVNNVALGYQAGYSARTGADNNILIGYKSADNLVSGSGNIVIGYDIDATSTTMTNALNIGNLIFGTGLDGTGTTLSSGNIGIGTTTPSSKFTVTQSADTATGGFLLSTADNTDFRSQFMDTSGVLSFYGGDTAGTLNTATLNAAGEWTNASDISYKENIENLSNGLDIALALKPRTYDIKNTDNHRIGFIAQEVEGIVPEVVGGAEGSKGISYGNLVAVAISAIQELAEKISGFASIFKSERIETKTLCVGGTCVTETELQELLKSKQIETNSSSNNNENTATEPVIEVPVITTQDNTQKNEGPIDVITTDVVDEEKNDNIILVESPVAEPEVNGEVQ